MRTCSTLTLFLIFCSRVIHAGENWAILVSTSRFWSNYRDSVNLYYFYNTVKKLGIPDSRIIVYLGEDIPCNSRNPFPGQLYANSPSSSFPVYPLDDPRVDVKGNEVNRENFLNMLSGRYHGFQSRSQRVTIRDPSSRVFVYFSGHSAVGFTKFQDFEDVAAADIADAFETMRLKGMFRELFWLADTCRAASLHNEFYSPGILAFGSSGAKDGDKAYSHGIVREIGTSLIDRFTHLMQVLVRQIDWRDLTMGQFFDAMKPDLLGAVPELKSDLIQRDSRDVNMIDFFGSPAHVERIQWVLVKFEKRNISTKPQSSLYDSIPVELPSPIQLVPESPRWRQYMQFPVLVIFLGAVIRSIS
jgi:GPI-anchor transamidase subunit K